MSCPLIHIFGTKLMSHIDRSYLMGHSGLAAAIRSLFVGSLIKGKVNLLGCGGGSVPAAQAARQRLSHSLDVITRFSSIEIPPLNIVTLTTSPPFLKTHCEICIAAHSLIVGHVIFRVLKHSLVYLPPIKTVCFSAIKFKVK